MTYDTSNSLPIGTILHHYEIKMVLGRGGFGITYKAYDTHLEMPVAIKEFFPSGFVIRNMNKTIRPSSGDEINKYEWGMDRFLQEAQILARFQHPSIVRVLNFFRENNSAYVVMGFEEGRSLSKILSVRKTLEETVLLRILWPLMDGLALLHAGGYIHRDIKPANIYIRNDGNPVLLDFGSARAAMGDNDGNLTALLTPGYGPYEQYFNNNKKQGPWTDIYALGALFYRIISGKVPVNAMVRCNAILEKTTDPLIPAVEVGAGKYSRVFLEAVDFAMAVMEKDRPQSIQEWRLKLKSLDRRVINTENRNKTPSLERPVAVELRVLTDKLRKQPPDADGALILAETLIQRGACTLEVAQAGALEREKAVKETQGMINSLMQSLTKMFEGFRKTRQEMGVINSAISGAVESSRKEESPNSKKILQEKIVNNIQHFQNKAMFLEKYLDDSSKAVERSQNSLIQRNKEVNVCSGISQKNSKEKDNELPQESLVDFSNFKDVPDLHSREQFFAQVQRDLAESKGEACSILIFYIINLLEVLEDLGKDEGVDLIKDILNRIQKELFRYDYLGILEQDRFGVICHGTARPRALRIAKQIASRINIQVPVRIGAKSHQLNVSYHVILVEEGMSKADLFKRI